MPTKLQFHVTGDCIVTSEISRFLKVPFDVDSEKQKIAIYEGDRESPCHVFTVQEYLAWQTGLTDHPLKPSDVFANVGDRGLEPIKSMSLRLAVRLDSYKATESLFVVIARTVEGKELARFSSNTEQRALEQASAAFMPPKGVEV